MDKIWGLIEKNRLYKRLNENRVLSIIFNREMIMYLFFGVLTTAVSIGSFWLFNRFFTAVGWKGASVMFGRKDKDYAYIDSNILSWICAVTFGFVTNKLFVFNSKSREKTTVTKEMASFFGSRLTTLLIDTGLMFLFVSVMLFNKMAAKLVVQAVVVVLNYIFSKLFVFKDSSDDSAKE